MPLLAVLDLDTPTREAPDAHIVIATTRRTLDAHEIDAASDCALILTAAKPSSAMEIEVADVDAATAALEAAIGRNPNAAAELITLLRTAESTSVADALTTESLAYSRLLAGPEFARWRASVRVRPIPELTEPAVLLTRAGNVLRIELNRPERRNAFGVAIRDGLVEALDLAIADDSIERVELVGNGPAFCSGGDLDEFGSTTDVVFAHEIRMERSVARRIHAVRERVSVVLHGACIGAGIELPSFAGQVSARRDVVIALPELAMGLVPGAGGTVGITRRIGRWRTAYLALSGLPIDGHTALAWGLIDELV